MTGRLRYAVAGNHAVAANERRWRGRVVLGSMACACSDIASTILLAVGQWQRITSGEPFAIVTGLGLVGFWASLFLLTRYPPREERTSPAAWRRTSRRSALVFGIWALVAWAWLGAAAVLYSVKPINLLVPAIPTGLALLQLPTYFRADRIALLQMAADSRNPDNH